MNTVIERQVSLLCRRIMPTTSCERGKEREVCGGEMCVCEVAHWHYSYCLPLYGKKREKEGYAVRLNSVSVCGCVDFAIVMKSGVMSQLYRVGAHTHIHKSNRIILGEIKSSAFVLLELKLLKSFSMNVYISSRSSRRQQKLITAFPFKSTIMCNSLTL